MKIFTFFSFISLLVIILSGCSGNSGGKDGLTGDTLNAREKPVYSENGKLHYIVEYKDGKANGRVREYSSNGKIYMDAIYKDDQRNGKCYHYFSNGKPFSVSHYTNGVKDSVETKYYESGEVLALVPYKNDKVQPGLREFKRDGTPVIDNNSLLISEVDHTALEGRYYIRVKLSSPRKEVKYYASPQSDPEVRDLLKMSGEFAIFEISIHPGGFVMKKMIFEAEYKTQMRNTLRLQKFYNLAIDR